MAARATTVKKYVVRLSREERGQLDELIRKGKRTAQLLTKARILLKADVLASSDSWSDSRITEALDTSIATTTILNPAPARALQASVFASVDYLTPNESELRILLNASS